MPQIDNVRSRLELALPPAIRDRGYRAQGFFYTLAWNVATGNNLTANSKAKAATVTMTDADFICFNAIYSARVTATQAAAANPTIAVEFIQNTAAGTQLTNQQTFIEDFFGNALATAALPEWPVPLYLPQGSQIVISLAETGGNTYDVNVVLFGARIYKPS